jgi:DNA-binding GntR family transcriptional regulator
VRIIEQSGLVHHEVNRGAVVRSLRVTELEDLYRVRELLELNAVGAVAKTTDLSRVRRALDDLSAAAKGGDIAETVERDVAFHGALVSLLGSPTLDRFADGLLSQMRLYLTVLSVEFRELERPGELIEQHAAILRALEAMDKAAARALLGEHLRMHAQRLIPIIREREAAAAASIARTTS